MRGTLTLQNSKTSIRIHGNSTQLCHTDEVNGSDESGGRPGADAEEIRSESQMGDLSRDVEWFFGEKTTKSSKSLERHVRLSREEAQSMRTAETKRMVWALSGWALKTVR